MAKKIGYLGNVIKEVKQTAKNANNAVDKYLDGNRGNKIGPSNVKKEAGQLAGAVLQGRRYSDKTGKQITVGKMTAAKKNARATARPMNVKPKASTSKTVVKKMGKKK